MFDCDYQAPRTFDELWQYWRETPNAKLIAGGTDLLVQMRNGVLHPQRVLDLKHLPLSAISHRGAWLEIGACVTHTQLVASPELQHYFPALVDAARWIGGPPTRNRGTLGGNLVNASPAADTIPPLLVYGAEVVLCSARGERRLPLARFYRGYRETCLEADEILQAVYLPVQQRPLTARMVKFGKRKALYIAVLNIVVGVSCDTSGHVVSARIALGCVGPTVFLAEQAAAVLIGRPLDKASIAEAAAAAEQEAAPISDVRAGAAYRKALVPVLVRRLLTEIATSEECN